MARQLTQVEMDLKAAGALIFDPNMHWKLLLPTREDVLRAFDEPVECVACGDTGHVVIVFGTDKLDGTFYSNGTVYFSDGREVDIPDVWMKLIIPRLQKWRQKLTTPGTTGVED